jgi:hypothetical protein
MYILLERVKFFLKMVCIYILTTNKKCERRSVYNSKEREV